MSSPVSSRAPSTPSGRYRSGQSRTVVVSCCRRWSGGRASVRPWSAWLIRISANLVGALGAAYFSRASLQFYLQTHRLIGAAFLGEQMWIVVAYLIRRPARAVSRRLGDWMFAFGGTFGPVLFRPVGSPSALGGRRGLALQLLGLAMAVASFVALGRSFGFAAADRGLVRRGPYAVVATLSTRYLLLMSGYVLQSISLWNALVMLFVTSCNIGRALVEERLLATSERYQTYRMLRSGGGCSPASGSPSPAGYICAGHVGQMEHFS